MQTLLIITYDNKKKKRKKKKEHMTLMNMVCDTLGHVKCVPVCVFIVFAHLGTVW